MAKMPMTKANGIIVLPWSVMGCTKEHLKAIAKENDMVENCQPVSIPVTEGDDETDPAKEEYPPVIPMSEALLYIEKQIAEMSLPDSGEYPVGATGIVMSFFVGGTTKVKPEDAQPIDEDKPPKRTKEGKKSRVKSSVKSSGSPSPKKRRTGDREEPTEIRRSGRNQAKAVKEKQRRAEDRELLAKPVVQMKPKEVVINPHSEEVKAAMRREIERRESESEAAGGAGTSVSVTDINKVMFCTVST